jgi:peptidyl-prolyl cis-trans isomerase SurA
MKNIVTLSTFLFLSTLYSSAYSNQEGGVLLDRIVAVVNDEIILKSSLDTNVAQTKAELKNRGINIQNEQELNTKVLDKVILEKLQLQRIDKRGIEVSDDELLEKIAEIAKNNKLSILQVRDKLNQSQQNGFSIFRENIRQQLLFQKLRQVEVLAQTQVTEDEINQYLQRQQLINDNQEYHLGHIIINLPESATPKQRDNAQSKAKQILKKLNTGEDFKQIAVRYSQGGNALQGGDLGWLKSDQIPTFFSEELDSMEISDHSQLIKSSIGFHIIKLLGKRDRDAKIVTQYRLHRFTILSDNVKQNPQATAPSELVELTKNILSLQDFKNLHQKYPDIPKAINANTDLGWQTVKQIPDNYYQALQNIKPKQASLPIISNLGWDILYLEATREKDLNITNKRQLALNTIRLKKANETFEIWLRRLKDEALIDIRL